MRGAVRGLSRVNRTLPDLERGAQSGSRLVRVDQRRGARSGDLAERLPRAQPALQPVEHSLHVLAVRAEIDDLRRQRGLARDRHRRAVRES